MNYSNIVIANDHAAVEAKFHILEYLKKYNFNVVNLGTDSNESVDYPKYALKLAQYINKHKNSRGILLCGSGQGISIAANKLAGIRCMLCHSPCIANISRRNFDTNVLAMGSKIIGISLMETIIDIFLNTEFDVQQEANKIYIDNMVSSNPNDIIF